MCDCSRSRRADGMIVWSREVLDNNLVKSVPLAECVIVAVVGVLME